MRELQEDPSHPHRVTDPTARPYDEYAKVDDHGDPLRPSERDVDTGWRERPSYDEDPPVYGEDC
jgi:hypothetical protein